MLWHLTKCMMNVCYVSHVFKFLLLQNLNVMRHDDVEPYLGLMLVESLCYVPSYVEKTHVLIMSSHCKMCIMFENYVI